MHGRLPVFIVALALAGSALGGCGGGSGAGSSTDSMMPAATATAVAPKPKAAVAQRLRIVNFDYAPATITVAAGTKVTWVNEDASNHTVTADDGAFDLGNVAEHSKVSHRFAKAGTFAYHCQFHPNMHAKVIVR